MSEYTKSFLKWAGGKYKLLNIILPHLYGYETLVEPFAGSGVVWLNSDNKIKIVNDINSDLINLYNTLDSQLIEECQQYFIKNTEENFYQLRELFNSTTDIRIKSALFIYLNRHCFNGLCRYNSKGKFNVPCGKYKTVKFPEEEMKTFIHKKANVLFKNQSFQEMFKNLTSHCVVYCDPPYDVVSKTSYFTDYAKEGFNKDNQKQLAELVKSSPCKVIVSNHDTPFIREIYAGLKFIELEVQRNISCKGEERKKAKELLIVKE